MKKLLAFIFFTAVSGYLFCSPALATVYFKWDSEDQACGTRISNPPMWPYNGSTYSPVTVCGDAPDGKKYFQWHIKDNQHDAYNVLSGQKLPLSLVPGKTYYLAFKFNFTRMNGKDVWCNEPDSQVGECQDKLIELTGTGVRWVLSTGERGMKTPVNRFSTFIGNARPYHLNPHLEEWGSMYQNQNGYSRYNSIPLGYDRWYSAVFAIKMASNETGSVAYYIDGVKILEHKNIKTMAYSTGSIKNILMNGTISQPRYDVNEHLRKFDSLLLTDDWQDIIAGGYLGSTKSDPIPVIEPPTAPKSLRISDEN
jgi:hypothetical protein